MPEAARPLFEDSEGRLTLAYELVDIHVCAAARGFVGNMFTPYAHAVCYERDGVLAGPNNGEPAASRKECADVYGRDEAQVKSSLKGGRGFF